MTTDQKPIWESMRTDESRMVEDALLQAGFDQVDAYRYNSASLRVRGERPVNRILTIRVESGPWRN
jgi:hypothetical protein